MLARPSLLCTQFLLSRKAASALSFAVVSLSPNRRLANSDATTPKAPTAKKERPPTAMFEKLLHQGLISQKTLDAIPHTHMTPVQEQTMLPILEGRDCLAQAKTGTGKTLAFLVPSIEILRRRQKTFPVNKVGILVISPTRELAMQIAKEAEMLTKNDKWIGIQTLVGGIDMKKDFRALQAKPFQIVICTPGRIKAHFEEGTMKADCNQLQALILDEADRLLDQGFRREIEKIIAFLPNRAQVPRQTLLFSATIPQQVKEIARLALNPNYEHICTISPDDTATHDHVSQHIISAPDMGSVLPVTLQLLLTLHREQTSKMVVFLPTARLTQLFFELFKAITRTSGLPECFEIHSRKSQAQRTKTAAQFKDAKTAILFSSDVSARGMDFPGVQAVVQVGMPSDREQYIHRLGRTGRGDSTEGEGYLILAPFETPLLNLIKDIPTEPLRIIPDPHAIAAVEQALDIVDMQTKHQAYATFLGYYKQMLGKVKLRPEALVVLANEWARTWGCGNTPPPMMRSTVSKMGMKGVAGLNVVSQLPGMEMGNSGGGRGPARSNDNRARGGAPSGPPSNTNNNNNNNNNN
ncbi:DEAD-domain-containing protein, partial [Fimicolochytrium jonesii]|uniref:DEAD-domain-containing protein n=1 Tax=Fimicolochytrium jonesii TaxID=1396493 RepID=UPI0022FE9A9B